VHEKLCKCLQGQDKKQLNGQERDRAQRVKGGQVRRRSVRRRQGTIKKLQNSISKNCGATEKRVSELFPASPSGPHRKGDLKDRNVVEARQEQNGITFAQAN